MLHGAQAIMFCNGLSSTSNIKHMSIKKVKIVYEKNSNNYLIFGLIFASKSLQSSFWGGVT